MSPRNRDDEDPFDQYCPQCGKYTAGDSVCPNCGIEIFDEEGLDDMNEEGEEDGFEEDLDPEMDDEDDF